jgi:hypothetical protein
MYSFIVKMDSTKFPKSVGDELGGLTFAEAFEWRPKIVEFVRCLWVESSCSGIFLDFYKYCIAMLNNPQVLAEHEERCRKFVLNRKSDIASYMKKYSKKENESY